MDLYPVLSDIIGCNDYLQDVRYIGNYIVFANEKNKSIIVTDDTMSTNAIYSNVLRIFNILVYNANSDAKAKSIYELGIFNEQQNKNLAYFVKTISQLNFIADINMQLSLNDINPNIVYIYQSKMREHIIEIITLTIYEDNTARISIKYSNSKIHTNEFYLSNDYFIYNVSILAENIIKYGYEFQKITKICSTILPYHEITINFMSFIRISHSFETIDFLLEHFSLLLSHINRIYIKAHLRIS